MNVPQLVLPAFRHWRPVVNSQQIIAGIVLNSVQPVLKNVKNIHIISIVWNVLKPAGTAHPNVRK